MNRALSGPIIALAVASSWTSPAFAPDVWSTSVRPGCVEINLAVEPVVATVDDTVKAIASVANCGKQWDFVSVVLNMHSHGTPQLIDRWAFWLGPGRARRLATRFDVPQAGRDYVAAIAKSRREGFDRAPVRLSISNQLPR